MIQTFKIPGRAAMKILLFLGIISSCLLLDAITLLKPAWQKLDYLQKQSVQLNQQWLKQQAMFAHDQQLQRDLTILQYSYSARLQSLRKPLSSAELYTQINSLAKSHGLKILELKPQKQQTISGLQRQVFNINLEGGELKILSCLALLMHQSWLLEIQQLKLVSLHRGEAIQLQAVMAAYYE